MKVEAMGLQAGMQSVPTKLHEARLQSIPAGTKGNRGDDDQGRLMDIHQN